MDWNSLHGVPLPALYSSYHDFVVLRRKLAEIEQRQHRHSVESHPAKVLDLGNENPSLANLVSFYATGAASVGRCRLAEVARFY